MLTSEAKQSVKNITAETFKLNPSALVTLFEIDISDLAFNMGWMGYWESNHKLVSICHKDIFFNILDKIENELKCIIVKKIEYKNAWCEDAKYCYNIVCTCDNCNILKNYLSIYLLSNDWIYF